MSEEKKRRAGDNLTSVELEAAEARRALYDFLKQLDDVVKRVGGLEELVEQLGGRDAILASRVELLADRLEPVFKQQKIWGKVHKAVSILLLAYFIGDNPDVMQTAIELIKR